MSDRAKNSNPGNDDSFLYQGKHRDPHNRTAEAARPGTAEAITGRHADHARTEHRPSTGPTLE